METPVIIPLPNTTVAHILKSLQKAREEGGAVALGRVLTLVITTTKDRTEKVVAAANEASREHPMRIIVISEVPDGFEEAPLDAEIRLGGDAGASEVIILNASDDLVADTQGLINGLLLPDAPMVAWWPDAAPAHMSETSLGRVAGHRIADTIYAENPVDLLRTLAEHYQPGDVDLGWTRLTQWRALFAATLDAGVSTAITGAVVRGAANNSAPILLASWFRSELGVPVAVELGPKDPREISSTRKSPQMPDLFPSSAPSRVLRCSGNPVSPIIRSRFRFAVWEIALQRSFAVLMRMSSSVGSSRLVFRNSSRSLSPHDRPCRHTARSDRGRNGGCDGCAYRTSTRYC